MTDPLTLAKRICYAEIGVCLVGYIYAFWCWAEYMIKEKPWRR